MVYLWSVMLPIGDCLYSLMLTRVALYRKLLRYKTRRKRRVGKPLNATTKQIMLEVNLCNLNALKLKENCTEYWNATSCQSGHRQSRPRSPTMLADFSSKFVKIQRSFHKTNPTGTLNGRRSTMPRKIILKKPGHEHTVIDGIVFQNLRKTGLHFTKLIPQGC